MAKGGVLGDSDNFVSYAALVRALELFAKRPFSGKEAFGERLIDDGDPGSSPGILRGEIPTGNERHSHRPKETQTDFLQFGVLNSPLFTRRCHSSVEILKPERHKVHYAGRFDSRQGRNTFDKLLHKGGASRFVVSCQLQSKRKRQSIFDLEARINRLQPLKTAYE